MSTQSIGDCFSEITNGSRSLSKDLNVSAKAGLHAKEGVPHTYPFLILLLKLLVTVRDRKLSKKSPWTGGFPEIYHLAESG